MILYDPLCNILSSEIKCCNVILCYVADELMNVDFFKKVPESNQKIVEFLQVSQCIAYARALKTCH